MKQLDELMIIDVFRACSVFAKENGCINLAQGIPEGTMDAEINTALHEAVSAKWQYADPRGIRLLRDAVNDTLFQKHFTSDEILITSGCSESLYLSYFIAKELYDGKVAFFEPFFPNFRGLAVLFNLEMVPIRMPVRHNKMTVDWNKVEAAFKSGVKTFVLNTPHNPSGFVMTKEDSTILRGLLDKYGVFLIIDYAYQYHIYDDQLDERLDILYTNNPNMVIAGSASKLLSATGLRVGWLIGNKKLLELAYIRHLYVVYSQPAPLQVVAATLINKCDLAWQKRLAKSYQQKRDVLIDALNKTDLEFYIPDGGYFLIADYFKIDPETPSQEFVKQFAKKTGVMTIPVEPFYSKNNPVPKQVRVSFSMSLDVVKQAADKLCQV